MGKTFERYENLLERRTEFSYKRYEDSVSYFEIGMKLFESYVNNYTYSSKDFSVFYNCIWNMQLPLISKQFSSLWLLHVWRSVVSMV